MSTESDAQLGKENASPAKDIEITKELQLILAKEGFKENWNKFKDDGRVESSVKADEAAREKAHPQEAKLINEDGSINERAVQAAFKKDFGDAATIQVAEDQLQKPPVSPAVESKTEQDHVRR